MSFGAADPPAPMYLDRRKMGLSAQVAAHVRERRRSRPGIGQADSSNEGRGRVALVTGASAGIGWCMSELLAAKGYDVVVVARREERLEALRDALEPRWGTKVHPLVCDLGSEDAPQQVIDALRRRSLDVDFLVNNAGYVLVGRYADMEWERERAFLKVMGTGVVELCHHVLPHMIETGWGRIINVGSVFGEAAGTPGQVLYGATKAMVRTFSEGLAAECEPRGVHCTVSLPGATDTEIGEAAGARPEMVDDNLLVQISLMRSETVVRQAYAACMRGERLVIHGVHHQLWAAALAHAPLSVRYKIVERTADYITKTSGS